MPPAAARLCLRVERFLLDELGFAPRGQELILAYSGGADSSALFYLLMALAPRLGFKLSLAHLDHALRPESGLEAHAALALAQTHGLEHYIQRTDTAALARTLKTGAEEAGREARLRFLRGLRDAAPRRWMVFAHQLDDLAEDMLMRLLRGTGWPALAGMTALDRRQRLLRPLLMTSRAEVEDFLRGLGAPWLDDPMNRENAFLRNRVRLDILPLFLRENPSFLKTMAGLHRMARLDAGLFQSLLRPAAARVQDGFIPRAALQGLDKALRLRLYKMELDKLGRGQVLRPSLLRLDQAWEQKKSGALIQFPGGKSARVEADGIRLAPNLGKEPQGF
jgi:tRNA(Ile)-lysidine synthase